MNRAGGGAQAPGMERFPVSAGNDRWPEFLRLEHATLPPPFDVLREGDEWIVRRSPIRGRRIAAGRIPGEQAPALFLQAAAVCAFLQAFGFWLDEDDLAEAVFDHQGGSARLWLVRTPAGVHRGGPGPAPSAVLAAFLHRIFARGRRVGSASAQSLFDRLMAPEAAFRRADFWLASAYRSFPELSRAQSAPARARTVGSGGTFFREPLQRARLDAASHRLAGRTARIFTSGGSCLTPGAALGIVGFEGSLAEAARRLRQRHAEEASARGSVWIAVEPSRWDELSRRAFESASRALKGEIEVRVVEGRGAVPRMPDEWRREIFVPCGTLGASLRFYDELAEMARPDPDAARDLVFRAVSSEHWGPFAADPTGNAPLPLPRELSSPISASAPKLPPLERAVLEILASDDGSMEQGALHRAFPGRRVASVLSAIDARGEASQDLAGNWRILEPGRRRVSLSDSRRRELCRQRASVAEHPGRRIELLLAAGDIDAALEEGERWFRAAGGKPVEQWFGLSAHLSGRRPDREPAWLSLVEAERELAGGRAEEAERRFASVSQTPQATDAERRRASLRIAEVRAHRGRWAEAGRLAAAFRRSFPDAPAEDHVRALRLEAVGRSREGDHEAALRHLDEAGRVGASEPFALRLETALVRADVYSAAGRFREEKEIYDGWRAAVSEQQDDFLTARLLAREALGLSDRREFAPAVARLEEALAVTRDDAGFRAQLLLDLAATLYHAGRPGSCVELLEEAIDLSSATGRQDLLRTARTNRLELWISQGRWEEASREIDSLLRIASEEGDELWRLVVLHHRSRHALRRGFLEEAARDNAESRSAAVRFSDRLEVGELWLEEGDRCLYTGDFAGARHAYEVASRDLPDRCDSDARARQRLAEMGWTAGPPAEALEELRGEFARDEYAAAERVARWHASRGGQCEAVEAWCRRAEATLRRQGGERLAARVFGEPAAVGAAAIALADLAGLRRAAACGLAGQEVPAPLASCGLTALAVEDAEGREILALGERPPAGRQAQRRRLDAGQSLYEILLWPTVSDETSAAIAFLMETLLFRAGSPPLPADFSQGWRRLGVVAADVSMEEPYRRLVRFAPQNVTVLVLGESGSGKEAVARAVHSLSSRAAGPFVAVNVPAIPAPLLESELFGHARGAFTGADRDRRGLLEEAHGGTIFFDEVGDLTLPLQAKLLRALQEREIRRVGENRSRGVDVRVVSATSRQLGREVEKGAFREDLYYRLHVAVIALPPLRDRGRDSVLLARALLAQFAREYGRGDLQFSPEAISALAAHAWPGNVRELQNAVAQAAALAEVNGTIGLDLLPETIRRPRRPAAAVEDYRTRMDAHRRGLITEALDRAGGNRSRAARELGLSRQALLYLIRELNVAPRPRSDH